ncbi:MAG: hypothetical protein ABFC34_17300 [Methanobacterium sp.]
MIKKKLTIIVLCAIVIILTAASLNTASSTKHTTLGSDSRGYVIKDVYMPNETLSSKLANFTGTSSQKKAKVAVVTGIHPRETLSINVSDAVVKDYAKSHDVEIVHYTIVVHENFDYYTAGRNKGQGLAADYIIQDVAKSDYDVIIICHDHKKGYGEGFYIATPSMDNKSVTLAEKVDKAMSGLRFLPSDENPKKKGTSTEVFTKPLAATGHATFVYEIPEWVSYSEAYNVTYNLVDTAYNSI